MAWPNTLMPPMYPDRPSSYSRLYMQYVASLVVAVSSIVISAILSSDCRTVLRETFDAEQCNAFHFARHQIIGNDEGTIRFKSEGEWTGMALDESDFEIVLDVTYRHNGVRTMTFTQEFAL